MGKITEIQERLAKADAGPWRYDVGNGEIEAGANRKTICLRAESEWPGNAPNMELIERAPEDLRYLLDAYAKAIAALKALENETSHFIGLCEKGHAVSEPGRLTLELYRKVIEPTLRELGEL